MTSKETELLKGLPYFPHDCKNISVQYPGNQTAETKDLTPHDAPFYIKTQLTLLYLPAENHLGFCLWSFYEQSCHAEHSMVQAPIQLWGRECLAGRRVCQALSIRCLKLLMWRLLARRGALQPGSNVRKAHCAAVEKPRVVFTGIHTHTHTHSFCFQTKQDRIRWIENNTTPYFPHLVLWKAASQLATVPLLRWDNNRQPCTS